MKRFIKYFLCLLISLCVFAGTGCGFDVFGSGSGTAADAPLIIRMLDIGQGDAILIERNGKFALIDTGDVEHRPRMAFPGKAALILLLHPKSWLFFVLHLP